MAPISSKSISGKPAQGGGMCAILFGLVFAGMGGLFTYFLASQFLEEAATHGWDETLCEINSVEIVEDQSKGKSPFQLAVTYSYAIDGKTYSSNQYTLQERWEGDYESLAFEKQTIESLADGTTCFVNPENPAEAVIKREALAKGLIILFPLVFVTVGLAILIGGILSFRKSKAGGKSTRQSSISQSAASSDATGRAVLLGMGILFTLIGAGIAVPIGILPAKRMIASKSWIETPCEIIWSRVLSHHDDDGTTYSVDIFYEYEFEGQKHKSNRYEFMGGSSSGRRGKQDVVKDFPRGSTQVCFVNPDLPLQSTLKKGLSLSVLFGLIPLVFFFIGIGMLFGWAKIRKPKRSNAFQSRQGTAIAPTGPVVLKPGGNRFKKLIFGLCFGLFWNGIVSVFVYQVVQGFKRGHPEWFLTIFMIPFVLVGLGFILFIIYQLFALVSPRPLLTINSRVLRLGDEMRISWEISGNSRRLSMLTIELWGVESATYRRGTNTSTDSSVFFVGKIMESIDPNSIANGRAEFVVPADLVPSLKLGNNQIRWELRVCGDVPLWPDVQDIYEIEILPASHVA